VGVADKTIFNVDDATLAVQLTEGYRQLADGEYREKSVEDIFEEAMIELEATQVS